MISAVIITYNEAQHISATIESCKDIVDEIIIIDAQSNDDTIAIAQRADKKVRTYIKSWDGYGSARNYGAEVAQYDWILAIDADERCTPSLRRSIRKLKLDSSTIYQLLRRNIYKNEVIKFGFLAPEWKSRLYHRSQARWDLLPVHETLMTRDQKLTYTRLDGTLLHHTYDNKSDHLKKLDQYARLAAQGMGSRHYIVFFYLGPLYHFARSFFLKLGCIQYPYGVETSLNAYYYSKRKKYYLYQSSLL